MLKIFPFVSGCYFLLICFYHSFSVSLIKLVLHEMKHFESRFADISFYICFAFLVKDTLVRRFLFLCILFFLKKPFKFWVLFLFKLEIIEFFCFSLARGYFCHSFLMFRELLFVGVFCDLNCGCLVYMVFLRFSGCKHLINLWRQFRVHTIFSCT